MGRKSHKQEKKMIQSVFVERSSQQHCQDAKREAIVPVKERVDEAVHTQEEATRLWGSCSSTSALAASSAPSVERRAGPVDRGRKNAALVAASLADSADMRAAEAEAKLEKMKMLKEIKSDKEPRDLIVAQLEEPEIVLRRVRYPDRPWYKQLVVIWLELVRWVLGDLLEDMVAQWLHIVLEIMNFAEAGVVGTPATAADVEFARDFIRQLLGGDGTVHAVSVRRENKMIVPRRDVRASRHVGCDLDSFDPEIYEYVVTTDVSAHVENIDAVTTDALKCWLGMVVTRTHVEQIWVSQKLLADLKGHFWKGDWDEAVQSTVMQAAFSNSAQNIPHYAQEAYEGTVRHLGYWAQAQLQRRGLLTEVEGSETWRDVDFRSHSFITEDRGTQGGGPLVIHT